MAKMKIRRFEDADETREFEKGRFEPCPDTPNCVSSDAPAGAARVKPFGLAAPPARAWELATQTVAALPRTRIVVSEKGYLRAECRTPLLGFVDDLELELRPAARIIAVRSASRIGQWDLGVNRRRVETLRRRLRRTGAIR